MRAPKNWHPPIEYQVLELQQIAHRTGWHQGGREHMQWAIQALRQKGHLDAADFLEELVFGKQAVLRVQSPIGLVTGEHEKGNQTTEVKAPDTAVRWPSEKPGSGNASDNKSG